MVARHHAGITDVFDINLILSAFSSSLMLWWWTFTRQLLQAEQSLLEEHLSSKARAASGLPATSLLLHAPSQAPAITAPGGSLPTSEQFLEQAPHTNALGILALLERLSSVPHASASHGAGAVLIIIKHLRIPNKASQLLTVATTASALVTAAKNVWLLCPKDNKHRLRPELRKLWSRGPRNSAPP